MYSMEVLAHLDYKEIKRVSWKLLWFGATCLSIIQEDCICTWRIVFLIDFSLPSYSVLLMKAYTEKQFDNKYSDLFIPSK